MDDTLAVLDAAGSQWAVLFGEGNAGALAIMFAATYPERTRALILMNSYARFLRDTDYPWGVPSDRVPRLLSSTRGLSVAGIRPLCPRPRWRRMNVPLSLGQIRASVQLAESRGRDLRGLRDPCRRPSCPRCDRGTHSCAPSRRDQHVRVGHGRYLAQNIPGGIYRELPGDGHPYWAGDDDQFLSR